MAVPHFFLYRISFYTEQHFYYEIIMQNSISLYYT